MVDRNVIWNRLGAFTGVIFVVLLAVGMGIAQNPDVEPSDPSIEIARAYVDRSDQAEIGAMIGLVGLVFFFGFLAFFRRRLQQAEGEGGWLTSTAYGGGLVTAAMLLVMLSMTFATTSLSPNVDTVVAKVFVTWDWNAIWILAPPMIALTLGSSLVIVRYSALPRWVGWLGFPVALTLLVPWIGAFVTLAWILLVSIVLTYQAWRGLQQAPAR